MKNLGINKKIPEDAMEEAKQMFDDGLNIHAIANYLGVST